VNNVKTVKHPHFGKVMPLGRYAEAIKPEDMERAAIRSVGIGMNFDVEARIWPSRAALLETLNKQDMEPDNRLQWRPVVARPGYLAQA